MAMSQADPEEDKARNKLRLTALRSLAQVFVLLADYYRVFEEGRGWLCREGGGSMCNLSPVLTLVFYGRRG